MWLILIPLLDTVCLSRYGDTGVLKIKERDSNVYGLRIKSMESMSNWLTGLTRWIQGDCLQHYFAPGEVIGIFGCGGHDVVKSCMTVVASR